jgi:hypothetical protein
MTEQEWLDSAYPGTVLAGIRRHARFRAGAGARKARLATCEILRLVVPTLGNASWTEPIELSEHYAEGRASLADVDAAIDRADAVTLQGTQTARDALRLLAHPDPFAAANNAPWIAGNFLGYSRGKPAPVGTDPQLQAAMVAIFRDIFGNPFRTAEFDPDWRTSTAVALARGMYDTRDFGAMPILADALQDAGCDNDDVLDHCRGPGPHLRGCWVVDLVLGKV